MLQWCLPPARCTTNHQPPPVHACRDTLKQNPPPPSTASPPASSALRAPTTSWAKGRITPLAISVWRNSKSSAAMLPAAIEQARDVSQRDAITT